MLCKEAKAPAYPLKTGEGERSTPQAHFSLIFDSFKSLLERTGKLPEIKGYFQQIFSEGIINAIKIMKPEY